MRIGVSLASKGRWVPSGYWTAGTHVATWVRRRRGTGRQRQLLLHRGGRRGAEDTALEKPGPGARQRPPHLAVDIELRAGGLDV